VEDVAAVQVETMGESVFVVVEVAVLVVASCSCRLSRRRESWACCPGLLRRLDSGRSSRSTSRGVGDVVASLILGGAGGLD
jgi:hypothetical protein